MYPRPMLRPFQVDHPRAPVRRCVPGDVVIAIGHEVRPRGGTQTAVLHRLWLDWRMIECRSAALKEGADVVRQPEGRKDRAHRTGQPPRDVAFRDHYWRLFWHTCRAERVENVFHHLRLAVKRFPRNAARLEGVVLEGDKG